MPGHLQSLQRCVRQCILVGCLVPVSFVRFPHPRRWLAEVRQGTAFFSGLLNESDQLLLELGRRNPVIRILAGWPLHFARQVRSHAGVVAALRWNVGKALHRLRQTDKTAAFCVSPPGPVPLIKGLAQRQPRAVAQAENLLSSLPAEPVSIAEHVVCRYGEDNFTDSTVVVLACWDAQGCIPPYVHRMGNHFRSLGWKVVLASSVPPASAAGADLQPVPPWVDAVVWRTCKGYDVTSWKAALQHFPSLYRARELILNNDSVFGAIGSYAPMHEAMNNIACDFWGITESLEMTPHLQSYHLVFRSAALAHPAFRAFFDRVCLSGDRATAILFETRLALWLAAQGLRAGAFAPLPPAASAHMNPTIDHWKAMIEAGVPLLKRELIMKKQHHHKLSGWRQLLESKQYPTDLIISYAQAHGVELKVE